jgi:hypothetical protein
MRGITILLLIALYLFGCGNQEQAKGTVDRSSPAPSTSREEAAQDTPAVTKNETHSIPAASIPATSTEEPRTSIEPGQSETELWSCYRKARARAQEYEDRHEFTRSIEELLQAANCALKLERPDIAAWQYNNAAKQGIDYFIKKTSYRKRIARIGRLRHGSDKDTYIEECRTSFREHWPILEQARMHLDKALELHQKDQDPQRRSVIRSNRSFVAEVEALIS